MPSSAARSVVSGSPATRSSARGPSCMTRSSASVPGCGGPAVGLGPAAVRGDDDLCGMARAFVGEPGEPAVLPDLRLVERGAAAVDQDPAGDEWLGRRRRVPVEPAAEQVVAAATDPVQPGCLGGVAGVEADDAVRALIDPLPELLGGGDAAPSRRGCRRGWSGRTSSCSRPAPLAPGGSPPFRPGRSCHPAGTGSSAAIAG